jgi:hypothetical protein
MLGVESETELPMLRLGFSGLSRTHVMHLLWLGRREGSERRDERPRTP